MHFRWPCASSGDRRLFQTLRAQAVDLLTMFEMLEQSQPAAIGQIPASAEFRNNLPRITLGRGHAGATPAMRARGA